MAERPLSPEKQLLNLIEKPEAEHSLHTAAIKYRGMSLFSFGALKGRLAFLKNKFQGFLKPRHGEQLEIRTVNRILKVCVAVSAVYLIFNVSSSLSNLNKQMNVRVKPEKATEVKSAAVASFLKTAPYYLEKVRARDIFKMGSQPLPVETGTPVTKGPSQKIIEATGNFRLVGISWSDDPDVMIEDTKAQKTFFLKKSQLIDNGVRLKAVYKDKVILGYGDEEIDLR